MKKSRPELFSSRRFRELVDDWVQGELNQQILILFYEEDFTQEAVAEELHTSVSTVKRVCKKYGIPIFRMMRDIEL